MSAEQNPQLPPIQPIRMRARVEAGKRIVLETPDLEVGQEVEVVVTPEQEEGVRRRSVLELIRSFPPSSRTQEEWEQLETDFEAERNSWA